MLLDAPDVGTLFDRLAERVVSTDHFINPLWRTVFPSHDVFTKLASDMNISYHADLYDILNSDAPPPVSWFNSFGMVEPESNIWGVYFLLLEKPNEFPILYFGSRTSIIDGVRRRIREHHGKRRPFTSRPRLR